MLKTETPQNDNAHEKQKAVRRHRAKFWGTSHAQR